MMTSQVVHCLLLQMSTKVDFPSESVNALTGGFNPVCPISCFLKSKTVCLFGWRVRGTLEWGKGTFCKFTDPAFRTASETEANTIFPLSGAWQKINTDPICFGSRDDTYGGFSITKTGRVKTMKLVHQSGSIHCNTVTSESHWSCTHRSYGNKLATIITNANREALLPPTENLEGLPNHNHIKKHLYSLEGTGHKSPELVFRNLSTPLFLSRDQELQIWYGQDWVDCCEHDNNGTVCVDVYVWYI